MNGKERVLKAISFEKVDRVPTCVLDGHAWICNQKGIAPEELAMMDDEKAVDLLLAAYEKIDSDMVFTSAGNYMAFHDILSKVCGKDASKGEHPSAGEVLELNPEEIIGQMDGHPAMESQRRRIEFMNQKVGNEKLVMAFSVAPLTMVSTLIGMDDLMMATIEEPETVKKLMDFCMVITSYISGDEVEHGATAVSTADPVSSSKIISEDTFLDLSLPAIKKSASEWRRYGCPIMLHICGDSSGRLKNIRDLDIDIFSLDGGDLQQELDIARGHYAIFGNINTVSPLLNGSADEVGKTALELCQTAGTNGGFILAPGCDLAPATPLENVLAMMQAAKVAAR